VAALQQITTGVDSDEQPSESVAHSCHQLDLKADQTRPELRVTKVGVPSPTWFSSFQKLQAKNSSTEARPVWASSAASWYDATWCTQAWEWEWYWEYVGLARTVYLRINTTYIWWFPSQKYRMQTVYIWLWPTLGVSLFWLEDSGPGSFKKPQISL
jgi:hypothetical protein